MLTRLCGLLGCLSVAFLGGCGGGSQSVSLPDARANTGASGGSGGMDGSMRGDGGGVGTGGQSTTSVVPPACVPGASIACACVTGQQGAQTCTSAGTYAACVCAQSGAADAGADLRDDSLAPDPNPEPGVEPAPEPGIERGRDGAVDLALDAPLTGTAKDTGTGTSAPPEAGPEAPDAGAALDDAAFDTSPALIQYRLTVSKPATGSGTVISSPAGINCGTTCAASFAAGAVVTMTATADATFGLCGLVRSVYRHGNMQRYRGHRKIGRGHLQLAPNTDQRPARRSWLRCQDRRHARMLGHQRPRPNRATCGNIHPGQHNFQSGCQR